MTAYYNEIDPYAAQWLHNLISAGCIAPGDVDERSIEDVKPDDIRFYTQCHFFAGIGVWSYALRLAGVPDDYPLWTGSCPCQPFSAAGKGAGFADERHLWPAWEWLIASVRPGLVLGEQVASKDGLGWLDLVSADLEGQGYAFGAVDTCSAGHGAPHIRQRLRFAAYDLRSASMGLAYADDTGSQGRGERGNGTDQCTAGPHSVVSGLAHPDGTGRGPRERDGEAAGQRVPPAADCQQSDGDLPGPTNGFWRDADWILCRDPDGSRWRPVEPGSFPLAHGATNRVGRLRAYGNAVDAQATAAFCAAVMECLP